ncbi:hypothetical protein HF086_000317 [Spodoptera exigua]|uniref:SAM domain-containing protein n=1 Tax=Spodoptera exigua TaxID=7107 RepID=A0A922M8Y2_SPOEX|nr:hypothetical protein HF086_000317 [Spodoptera exigua]
MHGLPCLGEPDKADYFGNTALHLAAARGHKECVTFLINFGANVFAMDVDGHTAQEKKAKSLKEKAKKDYEKSHKQYQKRQSKAELMAEKELKKLAKEWDQGYAEEVHTMPHRPSNVLSASQPDFALVNEDSGIGQEVMLQEPASIFERPGFGSVAFRRSITATLSAFGSGAPGEDLSIGSAGSLAARHAYQPTEWTSAQSESSTITSDEEAEAEESGYASLERFLSAFGLSQYVQKFKDEQIDLDALMILTESDLKSLGLPLGPYRKLVTAIQERKQALSHPGPIMDTAL